MLDRNLNQFKVFDNRTAELVGGLSSADIPVEFAIVSFAGVGRTPGLEQDLTAFIGDCRQRGLPFIGYVITRERVGPGGKLNPTWLRHTGSTILWTTPTTSSTKSGEPGQVHSFNHTIPSLRTTGYTNCKVC